MKKRRRSEDEENLQEVLYNPPQSQRRKKKVSSTARSGTIGGWTRFHVTFSAHVARFVVTLWFCISIGDFVAGLPPYFQQQQPEYEERGDNPSVAILRDERNSQRRAAYDTRRALLKQAWIVPFRDAAISLVLIAFSGSMVIFVRQQ